MTGDQRQIMINDPPSIRFWNHAENSISRSIRRIQTIADLIKYS